MSLHYSGWFYSCSSLIYILHDVMCQLYYFQFTPFLVISSVMNNYRINRNLKCDELKPRAIQTWLLIVSIISIISIICITVIVNLNYPFICNRVIFKCLCIHSSFMICCIKFSLTILSYLYNWSSSHCGSCSCSYGWSWICYS